ncbi:MAG: Gfo/Idh/MocA family oxidoreductase, partial [Clostridia bacterium]|nr:Gfo/Idh/MocA family oxidoreductase [Clostridia bacterium]
MKKIKIGVIGGYRGTSMINYCKLVDHAEVVAICDKLDEVIEAQKKGAEGFDITFYKDYDEFLKHDMDAVVLANYANEHAPFAIKAMKAGKHVFSEVLPVQNMKEAVELVETIEETGMTYCYAENYCYMPAPYEMKRLFEEGKLGEFEYAECEYIHNGEPIWPRITYGDKDHWRNNQYATNYCTHSLGPIIHMTGLRPVKVTGFESNRNDSCRRVGSKNAAWGIEMVTLENGGVVKSIHGGGLYIDSYWFSMYGSKGRVECDRDIPGLDRVTKVHLQYTEELADYDNMIVEHYIPKREMEETSRKFGHHGSDFYCIWNFIEKLRGNPNTDTIDVYEALDMFLPGLFAYRSILEGGVSLDIPNLRNKEEREKWRNDTACTDPKVAGDMLLPTQKGGTPDIPDEVYDRVREKWEEMQARIY